MLEKCNFENPDKKPLNELFFNVKEDGVQLKIPALSERWIQPRCYTKYKKLTFNGDGQLEDSASIDEWLNEAKWFNKDLEFLLSLEHFRFWSHMVHEKQCIEIIICFLQEAVPYYISLTSITSNSNVLTAYSEILENVLRVICRMITNKESDEAWITKDHLKELLYSKFLISIPMLFDMIIAYGRSNLSILSKIIKTVFKIEPKYNEDLKMALRFLQNALITIKNKTEGNDEEQSNKAVGSFDDLALYTLDCASTLSILLEIYSEGRTICNEIGLEQSITKFYDNTIPLLYKNIYTINDSSKSLFYLNLTRMELLKAFRMIIYIQVEKILKDPENSLLPAETFVAILTECLSDRTFVVDYQRHYPIEGDIEILKQACKQLDVFRADFVLKAYTSEEESYLVDLIEKSELEEREECAAIESTSGMVKINYNETTESANVNGNADRDIEIEVSYVLDVLPHLGDGFIRRLLSRYENPEQAISAVLENNLPPDLAEADQNEIYIPADPCDKFRQETGIERLNVFNGDNYDVLTQDNPSCIIKTKKGFPGQPKNAKQLLDDKSYVKEMKERYQQYSIVEDDREYDDEYDDSYDAFADSESKITAKSKAFKNVIVDEVEDESENEEESSDDNNGYNDNEKQSESHADRDRNKDFCENPEIIRARYEASRNAKYQNQPKHSQRNSSDVAGKSKGQGQEKDVLNNRHKKEVHKSSRANHNRKSGASWKRSRGMIPS